MQTKKPLIIVLLGPTASGKTALSLEIAEEMNWSIQNIDSRQLYKGMDIGTAKPTKDEQNRVKHFLLDLQTPKKQITLHNFQKKALSSINKVLKQKKVAFLVGGSGLYLKSITHGLIPPAVPPQQNLRKQLSKFDPEECHEILQNCDPIAANRISPSDSIRTIRALEVFYATGHPISSQQLSKAPPWDLLEIGLNPQNLNERIEERAKKIYKMGLIEETKRLIDEFGKDLPLLKTIGYEEALALINGELNIEGAIEITIKRTKQFAKRQKTWFKNKHNPKWLNDEQPLRESLSLIQDALGCIN